jgi:hypothetical protein
MNDRLRLRERTAWVGVVAVLATSLLWLATLAVAMALRLHGADLAHGLDVALTVGRALVRALLALVWHGRLVLAALLASGVMAGMLLRAPEPRAMAEGRVRHG